MPTKALQYPNLLNLTPLAASGNSTAINLPPTSSAPYGVVIHVKFTIGSLTNATVVPQILNPDGSTWQDVYSGAAIQSTGTMAASTNAALTIFPFGAKQFRCRYTSTGTVTSSALVIDATCFVIY
jgi:hypothetical protein